MGRKAEFPRYPDRTYSLSMRCLGRLKQDIFKAAADQGVSMNQWVLMAVRRMLDSKEGIAPSPTGQYSLPDSITELQAVINRESVLLPCGKRKGRCKEDIVDHDGIGVCLTCNLRVY